MKKFTLTLAFVFACIFAFAQSPRLQIIEEFSGENCGPCAAYNPGFFATLMGGSNPSLIIPIKYQDNIPSAGPVLYYQTSTEVLARQTYYSVPFAPFAVREGKYFRDNVANFNQADI